MKVIQVTGKGNRPVPILLTEDLQSAMSVLMETRQQCAVPSQNQYFFALPQMNNSRLQFYPVLQRVGRTAGMKKAHLLTTTRVRKHLCTMAQVIYLLFK